MGSRQPAATLLVLVLFVTAIALGGTATDDPPKRRHAPGWRPPMH